MSDSAVITTVEHKTSLYLHWFGDRTTVEDLLAFCASTGVSSPEVDPGGWAQLVAAAANFRSPSTVDVGLLDRPVDVASLDYGVYVIQDWRIIDIDCEYGNQWDAWDAFAPRRSAPSAEMLSANASSPVDAGSGELVFVTSPWPVVGDKLCLALTSDDTLKDLVAACAYCRELGYRDISTDWSYGYARLVQVLTNYLGANNVAVGCVSDFEGITAAGPESVVSVGSHADLWSGKRQTWQVLDSECGGLRLKYDGFSIDEGGALTERLCRIASAMPSSIRIPESHLRARLVPAERLVPGDVVSVVPVLASHGKPTEEHVVLGLGADRVVNGGHVAGVPIIDAFECDSPRWWSTEPRPELPDPDNPNNYLRESVYRVVDHRPDDPRIPKMAKAIEDDYQSYLARTGAISL